MFQVKVSQMHVNQEVPLYRTSIIRTYALKEDVHEHIGLYIITPKPLFSSVSLANRPLGSEVHGRKYMNTLVCYGPPTISSAIT